MVKISNAGKMYLMNSILDKKDPNDVYIQANSIKHYPDKYKNVSHEILPSQKHTNKTVVFDYRGSSEQASRIDLFCTRGRHEAFDKNYLSLSFFSLCKKTIKN